MLVEPLLWWGFFNSQNCILANFVMRENTMFNLPAPDYQKEREQKLFDYLDQHKEEVKSEILIALARYYWDLLKKKVWDKSKQILEVPDCCVVARSIEGIDCIQYVWDKDEYYLECEILIDGTKEFFYKNRFTREVWGEDYSPTADISDYILDKLTLFVE